MIFTLISTQDWQIATGLIDKLCISVVNIIQAENFIEFMISSDYIAALCPA